MGEEKYYILISLELSLRRHQEYAILYNDWRCKYEDNGKTAAGVAETKRIDTNRVGGKDGGMWLPNQGWGYLLMGERQLCAKCQPIPSALPDTGDN